MKQFKKVRSTVKPEPIVIDEANVWVHSNIVSVEETVDENTFVGFEFDMVRYSKDEYIKLMADKNNALESELTDTQLALTEIYEGMVI